MSSQYVVTLDELIAGLPVGVTPEEVDSIAVAPILNPPAFVFSLKLWASVGFPANCKLFAINIHPPSPCPDGSPRTVYDYISFLLSADLDGTIANLNTQFLGIVITYTLPGNSIQFYASKA